MGRGWSGRRFTSLGQGSRGDGTVGAGPVGSGGVVSGANTGALFVPWASIMALDLASDFVSQQI